MHQKINGMQEERAMQLAPGDDLPCANTALLVPLKRSPEYRQIHPRLAGIQPIDSWLELDHHFFVFQLKEAPDFVGPEPPVAVFAMHPDQPTPVSVVVVEPSQNGEHAWVRDLHDPDKPYNAPYLRA
jgi:hypothetical protein